MSEIVALLELDAYHRASGHIHRFFLSTPPGFISRRTDARPDIGYAPLVEQAADIALTISSYGEMAGQSRVEVGVAQLANRANWHGYQVPIRGLNLNNGQWVTLPATARPLNPLITDYVLGGQRIAILIGPRDGRRDVDFIPVLTARQEMPDFERGRINLHPRDGALDFDTPLLTETYGGTGGLDGPPDFKGRTKERCWGEETAFEPTYLGTVNGLHTWSVNGGRPIEGVVKFRDGWVDIPETTGTPSATAGDWRQDRATGIIQRATGAQYRVSVHVKGDKSGGVYRSRGADLIRHWAGAHSGILSAAGLDAAAFTHMAAAAPYNLGFWMPAGDTRTHRDMYDAAVRCFRGFWAVDPLGLLTIGQVLPPSGPPKAVLRRGIDHLGLIPQAPATGRNVPARAALIRFARNHVPAGEMDMQRNLTAEARSMAKAEWREARTPDDPAVVAAYGANIARLIERDTAIVGRADAEAEGLSLRDDAKISRGVFQMQCTRLLAGINRLDVVQVQDDLPGFEAGRLVRVIGVRTNYRANLTLLTVRE